MNYHIITLVFDPVSGTFPSTELDEFYANHDVLEVRPAFFSLHGRAYWSFCIQYLPKKVVAPSKEVDPPVKVVLSPQEQTIYDALQRWRLQRAQQDGHPPFLVATNVELTTIAQEQPKTISGLLGIRGIGKKKCAKYGANILEIIQQNRSHESNK